MAEFLLTIAIPTYNRASLLRQCVFALITQIPSEFVDSIEIIISNNASSDDTKEVINEIASKWPIVYFENSSNIGPDANILQCFMQAKGRYVWIFSDDELLLPGLMKHLLNLLVKKDYGVIQLGAAAYDNDVNELASYYNPSELKLAVYADAIEFFSAMHYMATFITGIIFNKSILPANIDYSKFLSTNLVQLGWVIRAAFSGRENIKISTNTLACMQENSGGYKFITTFSKNYNIVLKALVKEGIDNRIIDITNENLITGFLPNPVRNILYKPNNFHKENGFSVLVQCFGKYASFWKVLFPIYVSYWIKNKIFVKKN